MNNLSTKRPNIWYFSYLSKCFGFAIIECKIHYAPIQKQSRADILVGIWDIIKCKNVIQIKLKQQLIDQIIPTIL